jgi:hypothetical protein
MGKRYDANYQHKIDAVGQFLRGDQFDFDCGKSGFGFCGLELGSRYFLDSMYLENGSSFNRNDQHDLV